MKGRMCVWAPPKCSCLPPLTPHQGSVKVLSSQYSVVCTQLLESLPLASPTGVFYSFPYIWLFDRLFQILHPCYGESQIISRHKRMCAQKLQKWALLSKSNWWQKQEGALWPSCPGPKLAVLPGPRMCSLKASPCWAVPCLLHGADRVCGVTLLLTRGYRAAATPVPRKAWWGRGRRAKSSSVASPWVLDLIDTDFDSITQHDIYCKQIFLLAHNCFSQFSYDEPYKFFKILLCGLCFSSFFQTTIISWRQI